MREILHVEKPCGQDLGILVVDGQLRGRPPDKISGPRPPFWILASSEALSSLSCLSFRRPEVLSA